MIKYVVGGLLWCSADWSDGLTATLLEVKEAGWFGWWSHEHVSLVLVSYVDLEKIKDIISVNYHIIIYIQMLLNVHISNKSLIKKWAVFYTMLLLSVQQSTK